jgi:acyl-CoA reductase-like NAD-dependent aldehyde dehydrogenase
MAALCRALATSLVFLHIIRSMEHLKKVRSYIDLGVEEGADLVVDGWKTRFNSDGFFLGASLFDHVEPSMRIYRDEIFGPVLCLLCAMDFDSAPEFVNKQEFGSGTSIFTRDDDAARAFSSRVKAGMVGVNVAIPAPMAFHSFGGWKRSLFGDTTCMSRKTCASTRRWRQSPRGGPPPSARALSFRCRPWRETDRWLDGLHFPPRTRTRDFPSGTALLLDGPD